MENCPHCGSPELELAPAHGLRDSLAGQLGMVPQHCHNCGASFYRRVGRPSILAYAAAGLLGLLVLFLLVALLRGGPAEQASSPAPPAAAPAGDQAARLPALEAEVAGLKAELATARAQAGRGPELASEVERLKRELEVARARAALADRLQEELSRLQAAHRASSHAAPAAPAARAARKRYRWAVGRRHLAAGYYRPGASFGSPEVAQDQPRGWRSQCFSARVERAAGGRAGTSHRVMLGPYPDSRQAGEAGRKLMNDKKISGFIVRKRHS